MQSFSRISAFLALVILTILPTVLIASPPPYPSWPAPPSAPVMAQGRRGMNPAHEFGIFWNVGAIQTNWFNLNVGNAPFYQDCVLIPYGAPTLYPRQGPHAIELYPGGRTLYYTQYIAQITTIVTGWITNPNYDGMIICDYEWFCPWYTGHMNFPSTGGPDEPDGDPIDDWRETLSVTRAAQLVGLNAAQREAYFKQEWLATTREFFERTYQVIKALRPQAKVGFYSMPQQSYWEWQDPARAATMRAGHDEVPWFWQMSDVIVPSIFSFYYSVPNHRPRGLGQDWESDNDLYVRANITEALRVANGKPVYPYVCFQYHESNPAYSYDPVNSFNMRHPLDVARELGCNGVVAWGWVKTPLHYQQLSQFIPNVYAPYITRFATLPANAPANPARPQRVR